MRLPIPAVLALLAITGWVIEVLNDGAHWPPHVVTLGSVLVAVLAVSCVIWTAVSPAVEDRAALKRAILKMDIRTEAAATRADVASQATLELLHRLVREQEDARSRDAAFSAHLDQLENTQDRLLVAMAEALGDAEADRSMGRPHVVSLDAARAGR
jgi:hypothetical protein